MKGKKLGIECTLPFLVPLASPVPVDYPDRALFLAAVGTKITDEYTAESLGFPDQNRVSPSS